MRSTCTAGAEYSTVHGSGEVGTFASSIFVRFVAVPALRVSSSGASAVTVIDSDIDGLRVMEMSAFWPTLTPTPARVAVPYPDSSALMEYLPGERFGKRKRPWPSVTADCGAATPVSVTVTPGSTEPSFAWTLP